MSSHRILKTVGALLLVGAAFVVGFGMYLARRAKAKEILEPKAAYGYWRCIPEGNTLVLLDPKDESREVARFTFPRQLDKQHRCITDFFHLHEGKPDVVALQVVTVGQRASDVSREWFAADRYQD